MSDRTPRQRLDYAGAIERLRRRLGMTQEALADASGISPSYLSEVERGYKRPSTDVMVKIAEALGMSPSDLLAYVERIDPVTNRPDRGLASRGTIATPSERRARWMRQMEGEEASAAVLPIAMEPGSDAEMESRDHTLGILMALANRLEEEDLRVLIRMAQRMGRSSG